jgi:hypothetical protein
MADPTNPWAPTDAQAANLGMGNNPFLGQANPYLQQTIDAASADMVKNYNLTQQPAFNAAMANSGSFGNAGVQQMNQSAQDQLQKNLANLSNSARASDYNQQQAMYQWQQGLLNQQNQWQKQFDTTNQQWNLGFDRNVYNDAYSQNMQNLQTGIGLLGTLGGYNANDLTNATTQQNAPLNYWQQFTNQANALGQGYGTDTSVKGTTSNPLASLMGGAQLGGAAAKAWGSANPSNTNPAWNPSYGSSPYAGTPYDNSGYALTNGDPSYGASVPAGGSYFGLGTL